MTEGSKDRFVNTNGGGGGGGNVTVTNFPADFPDSASVTQLASILAALLAGIGVTQLTSPWVVSGTVIVEPGATPLDVNIVGGAGTGLTDAELRATPVPVVTQEPISVDDNGGSLTVDGAVSVSNFPAVQPVSDNGGSLTVDGTVAVTGTQTDALTDAELRATPVPVSGTVSVTEPISVDDNGGSLTVDGTVAVSNFPASQAVTLTEPISVDDNGSSLTVDATDLDIRNLTFAADKVDASGSVLGAGSNNIGDVDVLTLPALPAGTNNIGDVDIASMPTGTLANGAQTAVSSSAVSILASNANRKKLIVQNVGAVNMRVGVTGVTATTGTLLLPNGTLILAMPYCPTQAIFAIRDGGSDTTALAQEVT